jgi:hypothetical protein
VLTITAHDQLLGSRQKSRLLPAATKLLSEKSASATFFLAQRSRQKSRLLPAATKLLSEKSASATFFQ